MEKDLLIPVFFKEGKKIPEGNLTHRSEKNDNAMAKKTNKQTNNIIVHDTTNQPKD